MVMSIGGEVMVMAVCASAAFLVLFVWACDERTSVVGELEAGNDRRVDVVQ